MVTGEITQGKTAEEWRKSMCIPRAAIPHPHHGRGWAGPCPGLGSGGGGRVFSGGGEAGWVDFSQKLALQTIHYCHVGLFPPAGLRVSHPGSLFCKNSPGEVGTAERDPPWAFKTSTGMRSAPQDEGWAPSPRGGGISPEMAAFEGTWEGTCAGDRGTETRARAGFIARL